MWNCKKKSKFYGCIGKKYIDLRKRKFIDSWREKQSMLSASLVKNRLNGILHKKPVLFFKITQSCGLAHTQEHSTIFFNIQFQNWKSKMDRIEQWTFMKCGCVLRFVNAFKINIRLMRIMRMGYVCIEHRILAKPHNWNALKQPIHYADLVGYRSCTQHSIFKTIMCCILGAFITQNQWNISIDIGENLRFSNLKYRWHIGETIFVSFFKILSYIAPYSHDVENSVKPLDCCDEKQKLNAFLRQSVNLIITYWLNVSVYDWDHHQKPEISMSTKQVCYVNLIQKQF